MRIAKLDLLAYGPFRGLSLDLSAPGIHVVLGRNEAGKSTTLRAITGLLYGIDAKTPDAHVHKFADLRIGGVLESAVGERIRVVRRKGNTNTLLNERDQALDESVMKKLLGGVSKETFTHAFGLTHEALAAGAEALLEGKGDLGESLFDASVGGGGEVQRLVAELEAECEPVAFASADDERLAGDAPVASDAFGSKGGSLVLDDAATVAAILASMRASLRSACPSCCDTRTSKSRKSAATRCSSAIRRRTARSSWIVSSSRDAGAGRPFRQVTSSSPSRAG